MKLLDCILGIGEKLKNDKAIFIFILFTLISLLLFSTMEINKELDEYEITISEYKKSIVSKKKTIELLKQKEDDLEDSLYEEMCDNLDNITCDKGAMREIPSMEEHEMNKRRTFYELSLIINLITELKEDEKLFILCNSIERTINRLDSEIIGYNDLIDDYKKFLLTCINDTGDGFEWRNITISEYMDEYDMYKYEQLR